MPIVYDVDVYRLQIARQFQSGGQAYRWLDKVRLAMHRACVRNAPARSGDLAGSHSSSIRGVNQYLARAQVVNNAEYAHFVHEGTDGVSGDGDWIFIPAGGPGINTTSPYAGRSFSKKRVRSVAGQNANPWIDNSCSAIARRYGAITIVP